MADIPGDTTTSTVLVPGNSISSQLELLGDVDMIRTNLIAGISYSFSVTTTSGNINPYFRIVDSSGSTIAYDYTSTGTTATFTVTPSVSGVFFLRLYDYNNDGIGNYTITSNGSDSIVDTTSTLTTLAPGGGIGGNISSAIDVLGDSDMIKTQAVAGLTFSFTVTATSGNLTPYLRLLNASGSTVAYDYTSSGTAATFSFTSSETGTFFLEMFDYNNNGTGNYTITSNVTDTIVSTLNTTATLAPNASMSSRIDVLYDQDAIRTTAVSGLTFGYSVTTTSGNLTPYLALRDASGSTMGYDYTSTGTTAFFSVTGSATGTFYLVVYDYSNNGTGTYSLSINARDNIVNNTTTTRTLAPGSSTYSAIDVNGDVDMIKTTLAAGVTYGFVLNSVNGGIDPYLALVASNGSTLDYDYSTGSYVNLAWTTTLAGTYYLQLGDYLNNNTGAYSLFIYSSGNDNLVGTNYSEYIFAGDGDDKLNGGLGNDSLVGGNGNDTYYVNSAGDIVTETATGGTADVIFSSVSYVNQIGVERLNLTGTGNLSAWGINNQNDILAGNGGNNGLFGLSGNDYLWGAGGNDNLVGGLGNDTLVGGAGNDIFRFDTAPNGTLNRDVITDFSSADDSIYLENAIFTGLGAGTGLLTAGMFAIGTAATQADDRIIYNSATGALFYDPDGVGGLAAVQFAVLGGHPTINASDFVVF